MTPTIATGTTSAISVILRDGDRVVSMTSPDPWYRLMRAAADLFIAGEIDIRDLQDIEGVCSGDGRQRRVFNDVAAREIAGALALTWMEPNCLCDPYREKPCDCPPVDRCAVLRERIGS